MILNIADNVISPLGFTSQENWAAVLRGDSALSLHTGDFNLPEPFFGTTIDNALQTNNFVSLQQQLMEQGAINYVPKIAYVEKVGHRIFGIWARFIRKKGEFGNPARKFRVKAFSYYLFFVLYVISPIVLTIYHLLFPIRVFFKKKTMYEACYKLE